MTSLIFNSFLFLERCGWWLVHGLVAALTFHGTLCFLWLCRIKYSCGGIYWWLISFHEHRQGKKLNIIIYYHYLNEELTLLRQSSEQSARQHPELGRRSCLPKVRDFLFQMHISRTALAEHRCIPE